MNGSMFSSGPRSRHPVEADPLVHLTRLAEELGDKPAVVMAGSGRSLSCAELDEQSIRIARVLAGLGLRAGGHLANLLTTQLDFLRVAWVEKPVRAPSSGLPVGCPPG